MEKETRQIATTNIGIERILVFTTPCQYQGNDYNDTFPQGISIQNEYQHSPRRISFRERNKNKPKNCNYWGIQGITEKVSGYEMELQTLFFSKYEQRPTGIKTAKYVLGVKR